MASSKQVLVLAVVVVVACHASMASAKVYMVGDAGGWRANFNQTGWGVGLTFVVGDSLMFMYNKEKHTVAQVGKDEFLACNLQGSLIAGPWNTGMDTVTLNQAGKMWFICTVPGHCDGGMKLAINVQDAPAPSPWFPWPRAPATPAPAPVWPVAAPPSAAVRNPVSGVVAAAAAAVVAAVLAF